MQNGPFHSFFILYITYINHEYDPYIWSQVFLELRKKRRIAENKLGYLVQYIL